jgi:hypothetical protein
MNLTLYANALLSCLITYNLSDVPPRNYPTFAFRPKYLGLVASLGVSRIRCLRTPTTGIGLVRRSPGARDRMTHA